MAAETVYTGFGSKANLLELALDGVRLAQDPFERRDLLGGWRMGGRFSDAVLVVAGDQPVEVFESTALSGLKAVPYVLDAVAVAPNARFDCSGPFNKEV